MRVGTFNIRMTKLRGAFHKFKKNTNSFFILLTIANGFSQISGDWAQVGSGSNSTWTADANDITITVDPSVYGSGTGNTLNDFEDDTMGCNISAYSNADVVGNPSLSVRHTFPNTASITFTFSRSVENPVLHLDRLGGGGGSGNTTTSSLLTITNPGITFTRLSGNDVSFEVTSTTATRSPAVTYNTLPSECGPNEDGTAAGSIRINGTFKTFTLNISPNPSNETSVNDRFEFAFSDVKGLDTDNDGIDDITDIDDDGDGIIDTQEICDNTTSPFSCISSDPSEDDDGDGIENYKDTNFSTGVSGDTLNAKGTWTSLDLDGDGIPNHLDLDTDGDGIPDIVEAQSSLGYNTPSGTDTDSDGLDDTFDTDNGGTTIALINTDGAGDGADYKDTNSDNEGNNDTTEAGITLSGTVGDNGLDSNVENSDDYIDVNGNLDDTQEDNFLDYDGDATSGGDVNYRDLTDAIVDTDGDGINDGDDLDDDNDGILDTDEVFSNNTCSGSITTVAVNDQVTAPNGSTSSGQTINLTSMGVSIGDEVIINNVQARGDINQEGSNESFTLTFNNGDTSQVVTSSMSLIAADTRCESNLASPVPIVNQTITVIDVGGNPSITIFATTTAGVGQFCDSNTFALEYTVDISCSGATIIIDFDSDDDGVPNRLDLDSDNDGIPDNIESQTTSGYIAPSGTVDGNGVDLVYSGGITPNNHDDTDFPDFLDTDSDNDGTFDIVESGNGLVDSGLDGDFDGTVSNNGLADSLDNGDTYVDVNGNNDNSITNNFTDTDGDVSAGGDLDYRDTITGVDTDGDGITNDIDIDDDNDGILDSTELNTSPPMSGNMLSNAGFDDVSPPGTKNNVGAPIPDWTLESGVNTNVVNVDGPGGFTYGNGGPESDARGAAGNYFDVANGSGVIYQTFTISEGSSLVFGGYFSARDGSSGNGEIRIHSGTGSSGTQLATTGSTTYSDNSNWTLASSAIYLTPGTYSFVLEMGNPVNFDEAFISIETSNDLDNDGILNNLDIDSDNDGIPDNVEAQSTTGYITPTGIFGANGLDSAYENNDTATATSSVPLTNTDIGIDTIPDYLDTDSDNDGTPDIEENGDSDNVISGTDSDGDGLDDNFEGTDLNDSFDINDEINTPESDLPDEDSDVATQDVDYRDAITDVVTPGIIGNILWLRADIDVTEVSEEVTNWDDQSASNHDATASDGPEKIDNRLNFNPTLHFRSSDDEYMQITGGVLETATYTNIWAYTVSMSNEIQTSYTFSSGSSNTAFNMQTPNNSSDVTFDFGGSSNISDDWGTYISNFHLWNAGSSTTASSTPSTTNKSLYRDGLLIETSGNGSTVNATGSTFYLGTDSNTSNFFNGEIAEVMIFNEFPSSKKQQSIQSYLAIKYGITLSPIDNDLDIIEGDYRLADENTKAWDYTVNSLYHNDVAGIGRDDAHVLNQKQSKSINSDAIITIGLGSISTSNATNANTFSGNKNFLVWGNNNESLSYVSSSELICAPEKTLNRIWKVQKTGSVGSVQIAVSKTTIDYLLDTPSTIKVIKFADDPNFTTNVEYLPISSTTVNGTEQYVTDFTFKATQYFTYAEINGIFWNGDSNTWIGGGATGGINDGAASTNASDIDKVMIVDSASSLTHATLNQDAQVECVWIKENSKLIVSDEHYLEFDEDFILDGEIRMIGDAQLVQTHTGQTNVQGSGKIHIDQKATVPNVYRYHYWSSPVVEVGKSTYRVGEVMKDGTIPTSETSTSQDINFIDVVSGYDGSTSDPITIANNWIWAYSNGAGWVQKKDTGSINRGEGYTMKSTGRSGGQNYTFVGTPNDGTITIPVTQDTNSLIGNPYPSALDAVDFINENIASIENSGGDNAIDGTLYFWEHKGEAGTSTVTEGHNIAGYQGGYATRNLAMGIAPQSTTTGTNGLGGKTYDTPGRYIAVGQSFFVGAVADGNITFKNSHRNYQANDGTNSIFLKESQKTKKTTIENSDKPHIRLGLEYTNEASVEIHRQIGLAFDKDLSFDFETGYDSNMYDLQLNDMYWKFPESENKYSIAGIQTPTTDLKVPLTITINSNKVVKIMIDGKFNFETPIYLIDKLTKLSYELTSEATNLSLQSGVYDDRFYISFNNEALGTDKFDDIDFKVYYSHNDKKLKIINPTAVEIFEFELINMVGGVIKNENFKNSPTDIPLENLLNGVYIIRLKTSEGKFTQKIAIY